jgi:hypothetical protein
MALSAGPPLPRSIVAWDHHDWACSTKTARTDLMIETIASHLGGLPREGVIALLLLLSLQAILQALALIDLARRRTVRGGKKWV